MIDQIMQIMNMTEEEIKNHSTLMVGAIDLFHRVFFWNRQCELYFGVSSQEIAGKVLEEVLPSFRESHKMPQIETALAGESLYIDHDFLYKTGKAYSQLMLPLKNGDGKTAGMVSIIRPLPEYSRTEDESLLQRFHLLTN